MCGIVGYIGTKKASPILIQGLLKLEYRGYDSAGIATVEKTGITVMKDKGRVKNLYDLDGIDNLEGTVGIAHTRWATHGKPSKVNSHPHMDGDNLFAVVHNGIIENYNELKNDLTEKGYKFLSQTDTEVIPNLINYYYKQEKNMLKAVRNACMDLKGSFAIEVISKENPEKMIVVRKDSPLVIGKGEDEFFIASDIPAILSYTKEFYLLNDFEFVEIENRKAKIYDKDLKEIEKKITKIEWDSSSAEKDGYEHFMLKEIYEQPVAIRETIGARLNNGKVDFDELKLTKEYLETLNKIFIVACGTAMHAGLATKKTFEELCKIPVEVDIASEFRYRDPIIDEKTLVIFISQSGETADTIAALKLSKEKGARTIAISNVIGSSITREADYYIYTHAGPEIAVASTKAYTSQITLLTLLAMHMGELLNRVEEQKIKDLKKDLLEIPSKVQDVLKDVKPIEKFAKKVYQEKDMFFLGRGVDYAVSLEGSLKLKEISYIHSEAYASGELKHGPIALIDNGTTVIGIVTEPDLVEKSVSNLQEVITRGAKVLLITNENMENKGFETIVKIPTTNRLISPILSVIPMQLLSYYISKNKGLDVDKPRNLAKSVTVE
ncbi:MAG: glutamine--fructose-6-phosphate transaminase (isomerizing) [Clostridia bacterium]|nr:glutamine--fructose-6-phosphate transaminase (isomerizing) [Clostridia bacterium]